jgi:hypothetical protein
MKRGTVVSVYENRSDWNVRQVILLPVLLNVRNGKASLLEDGHGLWNAPSERRNTIGQPQVKGLEGSPWTGSRSGVRPRANSAAPVLSLNERKSTTLISLRGSVGERTVDLRSPSTLPAPSRSPIVLVLELVLVLAFFSPSRSHTIPEQGCVRDRSDSCSTPPQICRHLLNPSALADS